MSADSQSLPGLEAGDARRAWTAVLHDWVTTVDHKKLGMMYIGSGIVFFVIAGIEASVMRAQLAFPENDLVSPEVFNRLFTMHGTSMVFLVGMPIIIGFGNYLIPLMVGARDMAFPRLNAWGFWMFLFGGLLLYFSFLGSSGLYGSGTAPDVGWFAYVPLAGKAFSRGNATDYWILGILISGFGSLAGAINMITTTITMRCKGMTLGKMPLFVWLMLVVSFMMLIALPPLTAAQVMLLFDRFMSARFFDTNAGGDAVLWQHFFWFFGHPEVYILMLPGFAYASEIIPVFSRKVIFGYTVMVAATICIGFVSLGVWAHHMFAVGMARELNIWFSFATMLVGIPTGIKLFNWIGTMYGGKLRLQVPMLFCIGFLVQFLIAGLTGIMLSAVPFDWQLTDSYFVVAHFHFVLIGGLLFTIFGAIYYWFPKMTGLMLSERLGRWHFGLFTLGFQMTFLTMHVQGLLGMPRRVYTYPADRGWETWNLITSFGVIFQAAAVVVFVVAIV
ncbi:MAG: cbb3-type cytochrome c oxidase subunit I, partial [Myxococcales bacterium]